MGAGQGDPAARGQGQGGVGEAQGLPHAQQHCSHLGRLLLLPPPHWCPRWLTLQQPGGELLLLLLLPPPPPHCLGQRAPPHWVPALPTRPPHQTRTLPPPPLPLPPLSPNAPRHRHCCTRQGGWLGAAGEAAQAPPGAAGEGKEGVQPVEAEWEGCCCSGGSALMASAMAAAASSWGLWVRGRTGGWGGGSWGEGVEALGRGRGLGLLRRLQGIR
ncbi:hypothetical protein V8C86DRAFT_3034704 [Haematococcus lacustris]